MSALSISPTVFTLFWSPPDSEFKNGIIRGYVIQITELETGVVEEFNTTDEVIVIFERHPHYHYDSIVAAVTTEAGPYSQTSRIHMPESGIVRY